MSKLRKSVQWASAVFTVSLLYVAFLAPSPTIQAATCSPTTAFKMTVKTDNPGTSNANSFTIPTTGTGYAYTVDINGDNDWSDTVGGFNESTSRGNSSLTISFGSPGTHTIAICGTFPRIYFNNGGDKDKVLEVTQWGDNSWTNMGNAFYGATNMDVTATDTPNLGSTTSLLRMFRGASSLIGNSSLNSWNTSNITTMDSMFSLVPNFNQSLANWNVSNVANMTSMFSGASTFNQNIGSWNTGSVTTMNSMFRDATAFNQNISNWNVSNVTNMGTMFDEAVAFDQPIGIWDTGSVTTMSSMFGGARSFNQPLNSWDVSSVTVMNSMFISASAFNQPLDNWDTSNVTSMGSTFYNASAFNQSINTWDTASVTYMANMFGGASYFNQPLNNWDTSNVTSMESMFRLASAFNQPLNGWDTSNVTTMRYMFSGVSYSGAVLPDITLNTAPMAFNQNLSSWDTSLVTNMFAMFSGDVDSLAEYYTGQGYTNITINGSTTLNHPFNQSLASWDVSRVTEMTAMLSGSSISAPNYDATLAGWSSQSLQSGVVLGAHDLDYCTATQARQVIIDQGWVMQGDSEYCAPANSGSKLAATGTNQTIVLLVASLLVIATILSVRKRYIYRLHR